MKIMPKNLNILYTFKCNFQCEHCCFLCSMERKEKLDKAIVEYILMDAKAISSIENVNFSGGEIFLFYDEIYDVLLNAKKKGFFVTCTTNGYWGQERENAFKIVNELKKAKLDLLSISIDVFHIKFIEWESIRNIILASKKLFLPIELKGVYFKGYPSIYDIVRNHPDDVLDVPINDHLGLNIGRAEKFSHIAYQNESISQRCLSIGNDVTIYPDGSVIPCCSPCMTADILRIGNVFSDSFFQIIENLSNNILVKKIRKYGIGIVNCKNSGTLCNSCVEACRRYLKGGAFR